MNPDEKLIEDITELIIQTKQGILNRLPYLVRRFTIINDADARKYAIMIAKLSQEYMEAKINEQMAAQR